MRKIAGKRRFRGVLWVLFLALLAVVSVACNQTASKPAVAPPAELPPLYNEEAADHIPDSYIVVLKPGVRAQEEIARLWRLPDATQYVVQYVYDMQGFQGFAIKVPEQALAGLRNNPNVKYLEADVKVSLLQTSTSVWGLDRIDQRSLPLDGRYDSEGKAGVGVRAYVIDTGVRATHAEFGGRVGSGFTAISDGRGTNDCNGHGTHVAGTVGGTKYGVAKEVALVPVRVLDCNGSGTMSGVIAGVSWVSNNATLPAVANMSLGGSASQSLDDAVNASINKGITYVVAAGNENQDACNVSPARVKAAITVGASNSSDARASFSNYGSCVDIFAPGVGIPSAWYTGDNSAATLNGTSMAAPHVAGVVALLGVPAKIAECSTKGVVTGALSTNNHLVYARNCSTKLDQTVAFTSNPPNPALVGSAYEVSAAATSGLPVSFTSTTTSVCTVSGTTVSLVTAGTCTVQASQAGNTDYNPAPNITQSFSVSTPLSKKDQIITFTSAPPSNATVGGSYLVSATASSGLAVSFASTTTGVCTVSGSTVIFVAAGTCTVQASQAGNTSYNPAPSVFQSFSVSAPATAAYTVNFSGSTVPVGRVISSVSLGRGISSSTGKAAGNVSIFAKRKDKTGNVAMVIGTPRHLIISKDGVNKSSYAKGGYMDFGFSGFGSGSALVKTLKVRSTTTTGGTVTVYRLGMMLKTISVPKTGSGVTKTLTLNVSNADLVTVVLTGPGAVDDLVFEAAQ
jgi:subtilisin family serine protease